MRRSPIHRPASSQSNMRHSISGHAPRRESIGFNGRASLGGSSLPRAASRISSIRHANQQPAFDFLTGAEHVEQNGTLVAQTELFDPSVSTTKQPNTEDRRVIELKAEINTLKYTISAKEQEDELTRLRQESEVRDIRRKADEDFKKMQHAEGERLKAVRLYEELQKEVADVRDSAVQDKTTSERHLRQAEEAKRQAEEEADDIRAEKDDIIRTLERKVADEEATNKGLRERLEEIQQDVDRQTSSLEDVQRQMQDKESIIGELEGQVLHLKTQSGDAEMLDVVKKQLNEQVTHIRALEMSNREQARELEHYKSLRKSVEIVEEEKRTLQRKVDMMDDLERELGEANIQRQRLEDERLAWTAYLQNHTGNNETPEFDSPEAVVRALVNERFNTASMLERVGDLEAQLTGKDMMVRGLLQEKSQWHAQLIEAKSAPGGGDAKAMTRLQRQKTLAIKEVEYLKAQLKALDDEEVTMELPSFSEEKSKRIQNLEDMVEEYRQEVQTLHNELEAAKVTTTPSTPTGKKRPREEDDDEQLGELRRKNRRLQDELTSLQATYKTLEKELSVSQERLEAHTEKSKTRILSLRSNPTSEMEAIKMSTLNSLRSENAALLSQLQSGLSPDDHIPLSTLHAAQREIKDMEAVVASKEKHMTRLKQIWGAKTLEFREGVGSLLGWKVDFLPNGKMKVTSLFYPSTEEAENSIVFDGENGTMKVSGGPKSAFAMKIRDQIKFWVTERSEIPLLLAALTMEFYEESRAAAEGV